MKQKIVDFDQDDEQHWRAVLACGHRQHLRHDPPLTTRTWVLTPEGRASRVGYELDCKRCDEEPTNPMLDTVPGDSRSVRER
jgi:hypothetical protein